MVGNSRLIPSYFCITNGRIALLCTHEGRSRLNWFEVDMAISYHHVFTLENNVSVSLQLCGLGIGYISLQCANVMLYGGLKQNLTSPKQHINEHKPKVAIVTTQNININLYKHKPIGIVHALYRPTLEKRTVVIDLHHAVLWSCRARSESFSAGHKTRTKRFQCLIYYLASRCFAETVLSYVGLCRPHVVSNQKNRHNNTEKHKHDHLRQWTPGSIRTTTVCLKLIADIFAVSMAGMFLRQSAYWLWASPCIGALFLLHVGPSWAQLWGVK